MLMGGIYELHLAASSRGRPAPGDRAPRVPAARSRVPRSCPRTFPQRAPHTLRVSVSPPQAGPPGTLPSPRLPDVPGRPGAGRGGRGARGPGAGTPSAGVGRGRPSAGVASSGPRARCRRPPRCSWAWHQLGGAPRAPQTGRRGAGAPSPADAGGPWPRGVATRRPGWLHRGSSTPSVDGGASPWGPPCVFVGR